MITVLPVTGKKLLKEFIDFPHKLYQDDKNYVPELFIAQRDLLTPGKHPFHEHSEVKLFLAYQGGQIKGRIAAILNKNHNQFNNTSDGFFGFFDCEDDPSVSSKLFEAALEWLKSKNVTKVIGPVNPSTNEPCGLLIKGFDSNPVVMMVYNKPYYSKLIENNGFTKKVDLVAYYLYSVKADDRSVRLHDGLLNRLAQKNITIRTINMRDFKNEAVKLREVYNAAWDKNLGFVPMTENEFKYLAKDLKMILDPQFCLVAEHNGEIVGFALAIPDINQVLKTIKRGRLLPFGIFKLLLGRKKINQLRVLALGVVEGYKKMGIEGCFYATFIKKAREKNILGAEASWILEDNFLMNKGIQNLNGEAYKAYRLFEKAV
ncbi:MAG TPA: hypothetical protein VFN30_14680 [Chitinophagaceae bacterium]|nr:hypothetical protein [Chitinophagaceae bacterium]